jgi:phosphinothricin acetyltransferase
MRARMNSLTWSRRTTFFSVLTALLQAGSPRGHGIRWRRAVHRAWEDSVAMEIRPAAPVDAAEVCAIYNAGIAGRQATFETRPRSEEDVLAWFAADLPFIVAVETGGRVVGWARVSAYSDRCVYEGVGEHGVYVDPDTRGQGVGRRLLEALAAAAEAAGYYKLTSRVFTTNGASLAVHRAAGFYEVGVQPRHGMLDGEWKDCVLVERLLGPAATA